MKFHFSISGNFAEVENTNITIMTNSNYNEYQHALNIILHAVQAEITRNAILLQPQEESACVEADDDISFREYEEPH